MHIPVPGRGSSNPYEVWVAEVMLQQTQVKTVWPYYTRWMQEFPDIQTLAQADMDQVLKLWEGLGYYSRGRNLHHGARYIEDNFGGKLPNTLDLLSQIPGIGPYTAAAIASMVFKQVVPLIDGNVLRVMSRLLRINGDISKTKTKNEISMRLLPLISHENPGDFNQGLMDLGRVVCMPKNPQCLLCPLQKDCAAFEQGDVASFPVKGKAKESPHYSIVIGLIRKEDRVLIQKRPESGLLGGLWEFPGGKIEAGETGEIALRREIKEETGLDVSLSAKIGTIKHAYTHFKITMTAWWCDWTEGPAQHYAASENRWVKFEELDQFAFPKANLKILKLIRS